MRYLKCSSGTVFFIRLEDGGRSFVWSVCEFLPHYSSPHPKTKTFLKTQVHYSYTGSGRNTWRFCKTVVSGTIGVGNLSLSTLLSRLKAFQLLWSSGLYSIGLLLWRRISKTTIVRRHFNIHRNECPHSQYFFLWGYLKSKVHEKKPRTTVDLKQNIREEVAAVSPNMLQRVMQNFQKR